MFNKATIWGFLFVLGFGSVCGAEIAVSDLPALTADTVGVATPFSAGVWGARPDVADLAKRIEAVGKLRLTRAQLDVFRQLILTDTGGVTALDNASGTFLRARLKALSEQGLFEDVLALIDRIPDGQQTDEMRRFKATALFGLGRTAEACTDMLTASFSGAEAAFIRAACVRETGTAAEAALAFDVYREGAASRFVFGTAAGDRTYRGLAEHLPATGTPSIWELPLAASAFGTDLVKMPLSRGGLRALALNDHIHPEVRLAAAERAFLSAADWGVILGQPVAFGDKDGGAVRRAGLYQEAVAAKTEADRNKAVRAYLKQAVRDGVLLSVAPAAMKLVYLAEPSGKMADVAIEAVRVSALNGELTTASGWYEALKKKDAAGALRLSVIMNAMGAGVPETIDPLIEQCIRDKTCDADLSGIPFYFPISADVAARVPSGISSGYPGFVTAAVQDQIEKGDIGIGLLNGLTLLAASNDPERPLISVMGQVLPRGMADALLMEQLAGAGGIIQTH